MKYVLLLAFCVSSFMAKSSDTLYVEDVNDARYLRYMDSLEAYKVGYAVALSMADTVRKAIGNNTYDEYFLSRYKNGRDPNTSAYFFNYEEGATVTVGNVGSDYRNIKSDKRFPWEYLNSLYKKLDAIKIQPHGIMQGGELPEVIVYNKPKTMVIYVRIKRYTQVDMTTQFLISKDGKTRTSYIRKFYFSKVGDGHQKIDSIQKLDPISKKPLFIEDALYKK
jgi:hypothetical protein